MTCDFTVYGRLPGIHVAYNMYVCTCIEAATVAPWNVVHGCLLRSGCLPGTLQYTCISLSVYIRVGILCIEYTLKKIAFVFLQEEEENMLTILEFFKLFFMVRSFPLTKHRWYTDWSYLVYAKRDKHGNQFNLVLGLHYFGVCDLTCVSRLLSREVAIGISTVLNVILRMEKK